MANSCLEKKVLKNAKILLVTDQSDKGNTANLKRIGVKIIETLENTELKFDFSTM